MSTVEVLAPGGSMEGIRAAVNAGADAVYAGGRAFGARAYAQNPEQDALFEAIDYCHLYGAKLYLTVNTLLKEKELQSQLYDYLAPVCEHGVDAVLVQDFGVFHFLKKEFPDLPLHASTQMTITGEDGVRLLHEMGAQRVVLSRELSLEEIRQIHQQVDVELETFVHGALCYCYSGQCLMSSLIGGRSGNRGRCAQPCRLPYEFPVSEMNAQEARGKKAQPQYLLSPKDICTLRILPDLIDAGIASLKIEGRMKSPEYAAGVTAMYRKYVDLYLEKGRGGYSVDPEDERLLTQLFSRGPYSQGYYSRRNGRDMIVLKERRKEKGDALRASQEAVGKIHDRYTPSPKIPVNGYARICSDGPMTMTVELDVPGGVHVEASGAAASKAVNHPAVEEGVRRQLMKTGDTNFEFASLQIDLEDGLFIPVKQLNDLRRSALEKLEAKILESFRRPPAVRKAAKSPASWPQSAEQTGPVHPDITASVCSMPQLDAVLQENRVKGVYLDLSLCSADILDKVRSSGRKVYVMMPPVWRADTVRTFERCMGSSLPEKTDGLLLRSFDQLGYIRRREQDLRGLELIADAGLYTWNREARHQLRCLGITTDTLPYECTIHELRDRGCEGSECVIYGYQTLMISAQCLVRTTIGCRHQETVRFMKDRRGVLFPVRNDCGICTNTIYNSVPLELVSLREEIASLGAGSLRYHFTIESGEETARILRGELPEHITRGHFRKGVE